VSVVECLIQPERSEALGSLDRPFRRAVQTADVVHVLLHPRHRQAAIRRGLQQERFQRFVVGFRRGACRGRACRVDRAGLERLWLAIPIMRGGMLLA